MYRYGLPLGCLSLALAFATAWLAITLLEGPAVRVGLGAAALLAYAGLMSIHSFERSRPPA